MENPFPFSGVLPFIWIIIFIISGLLLIRFMPFFQRYLVPACLIGGVFGLIATNLGATGSEARSFESWAYHLFNLSFISLGLTVREDVPGGSKKSARLLPGAGWMALTQGAVFGLQAAVGGLVVLGLGMLGYELFPGFGLLLPLGFEEGPGQALSLGKVWEEFGWKNAANIGLTFASIGFLVSLFIGIPMINLAMKNGFGEGVTNPGDSGGVFDTASPARLSDTETAGMGSVGALAFHLSSAGIVYFVTYLAVQNLSGVLPADAGKILWGFMFVIGLLFAVGARGVLQMAGLAQHLEPSVQRRATGLAIDFLVVATFCAVQFQILLEFALPVAIIAFTGTVVTAIVVFWLGAGLWGRRLERSAAVFGTVTGTVATGLLLLKVTDPDLRSGVAAELALMNILAIVVIGPCLLMVNAPVWWGWSLALTTSAFFGMALICLAGVWGLGVWVKRAAR